MEANIAKLSWGLEAPVREGVVEEKEITRHRDKCVSYLYTVKKRMEVLAKKCCLFEITFFLYIRCKKQHHSKRTIGTFA